MNIPNSIKVILIVIFSILFGIGLTLVYYSSGFNTEHIIAPEKEDIKIKGGIEISTKLNGEGSVNSPFEIKRCEDIQFMREYPSFNYVLTNDISCSGVRFYSIGDESIPFSGSFNGNGHTLSNMKINGIGLFGYNTGSIFNLKLELIEVESRLDSSLLVYHNKGYINKIYLRGNLNEIDGNSILVNQNLGFIENIEIYSDSNLPIFMSNEGDIRYIKDNGAGYFFENQELSIGFDDSTPLIDPYTNTYTKNKDFENNENWLVGTQVGEVLLNFEE